MTTWRVLTWNILGSRRPNLDVMGEVIAGYAPDVVAFQEIRHGQARRLARRLRWRMVWTRKHYPYSAIVWWRAEGLAIATPLPLSQLITVSLTPELPTWTFKHRVAMAATITRDVDELRIANVHLASHDPDERIAQARRVLPLVGERRPAVIVGDFNARDEIEVIREFGPADVVDPGGDDTNPSIAPHQRIDYILIPSTATVTAQITPVGGEHWHQLSDHLPVLVEFSL